MVIFHWIHFLFLVLESNGIESPDSIAVGREEEEQHHKSLVVSAPLPLHLLYIYIHGEWATRNSRAASWCRERERVHIVIVETEWRVGSHQGPFLYFHSYTLVGHYENPAIQFQYIKAETLCREGKAGALMTWRAIEHGSHLQFVPSRFHLYSIERDGDVIIWKQFDREGTNKTLNGERREEEGNRFW